MTDDREQPPDVRDFDLGESVAFLLRQAHFRAESMFEEIMGVSEYTPRQMSLLLASVQHPGASVADLAEVIALDRNTVAEMVPRLVDRGLLRRERSGSDGRAWSIFATGDAENILRHIIAQNDRLMEAIMAPLPIEYRPLFVRCLKLMTSADRDAGRNSRAN